MHNGCPVIILRIIADARSITTEKAAVICEVRLIWSTIRIVVMPPVAVAWVPFPFMSVKVESLKPQCS